MECQRLLPGFALKLPEDCPKPLQQVAELFCQDCLRVFNRPAQADSGTLVVRFAQGEAEQWRLHADDAQTCVITASDTRGAIYALLSLSRHGLGIDPWQNWLELPDPQRPFIDLQAVPQASIPSPTRYRGWFINDEILLRGWTTKQLDQQAAWKLACQTLLRLGGNLIIPGTMDLAPRNWALAESYGLIITHHHHEPLGSHMVLRSLKPFPMIFVMPIIFQLCRLAGGMRWPASKVVSGCGQLVSAAMAITHFGRMIAVIPRMPPAVR